MSKPTPEQIKSQKIRWAEDFLEHAETGKPMREWEFKDINDKWYKLGELFNLLNDECRRKPEVYTFYWCVVGDGQYDKWALNSKDEEVLKHTAKKHIQLTPIKKETVELQGEWK